MLASKEAPMRRAAAAGAWVYFAHIESPHRVERAGRGYHWEPSIETPVDASILLAV